MILTVKGADFSANAIGKIVDYSEAKAMLTEHYPSHADDVTAEAFQVFMNTLGKGTEGSIWDRLRWLHLPIFGSNTTEDTYDIKNERTPAVTNLSSLVHLNRGIVFSEVDANPASIAYTVQDEDLASIFYEKSQLGNEYMGTGTMNGFTRYSQAPVGNNTLSESVDGHFVPYISVTDGTTLMWYLKGITKDSEGVFRSNNGSKTYYLLTNLNSSYANSSKRLSRLCSHYDTDTAEKCNTTNPVMIAGSVKNMTDADAATIINAIAALRSALNV